MGLRILCHKRAYFWFRRTMLNLLTVVPIPIYRLWPYSFGAIELSLWLGVAGLSARCSALRLCVRAVPPAGRSPWSAACWRSASG